MKTTLSTNEVTHALLQDDNAAWSYEGAKALAEYLDEYEVEMETEMELDVVALRCDFSEHGSLQEWAGSYWGTIQGACQASVEFDWDSTTDDDEKDGDIKDYINENGQLIEFNGGIIVSSF
jgi:hypothetical protein